jgi:tight adherence protein C
LRHSLEQFGSLLLHPDDNYYAQLRARLKRAGLHESRWPRVFLAAKLVLMLLLAAVFGVLPYSCSLMGGWLALSIGAAAAMLGFTLPEIWLVSVRHKRQRLLNQALPDALDMLVLCLEGGVSLSGAMNRVSAELRSAHPLFAIEFDVVQREVQMGMTVGEAMQKFGERCELDDVKTLASVLLQSERYGASLAKPLRIHADTCRQNRHQHAEEMAQKAAVKILFPTLLCIFPAIFIVILGPAAYQIASIFGQR